MVVLKWISLVIAVVLLLSIASAEKGVEPEYRNQAKKRRSKKSVPQRRALESFANSLNSRDYNASNWRLLFHSRTPQEFFDQYIRKLSAIYEKEKAIVNFVMIGACDGITDPTIKYRFNKYEHWRGVFVEPVEMNFRDLSTFLTDSGSIDRSYLIRAAATHHCELPTIKMERPMYEEKNASLPHWLRRQIGSILPEHRDHPRKEWTIEEVRCVTSSDIMTEWSEALRNQTMNGNGENADRKVKKKRRPHVLKIDVEGHDYEVLMSFVADEIPVNDLPLLLSFEAKSIAKKYPKAKAQMEKRGYVVSDFAADGFALLRGDVILEGLKMGGKAQKAAKAAEDLSKPEFIED